MKVRSLAQAMFVVVGLGLAGGAGIELVRRADLGAPKVRPAADFPRSDREPWGTGGNTGWCPYIEACRRCIMLRVIDARTLEVACESSLKEPRVLRLSDTEIPADAPSARCQAERLLGEKAEAYVRTELPALSRVDVIHQATDFDGTPLVRARRNDRDVGAELLWRGFARVPTTEGRAVSWCD